MGSKCRSRRRQAAALLLLTLAAPLACRTPSAPLRRDSSCPASAPNEGWICDPAICEYPETRCVCRSVPLCSGVPHAGPAEGLRWICHPRKGTRLDGCPWEEPTPGSPCSGRLSCLYQFCEQGSRFSCVDGGWSPPRPVLGLPGPPASPQR